MFRGKVFLIAKKRPVRMKIPAMTFVVVNWSFENEIERMVVRNGCRYKYNPAITGLKILIAYAFSA